MPRLPVPEAVRDMERKIEQILELLRAQNHLLSQIVPQCAELHSDLKKLPNLDSRLGEITNSLTLIKDAVRFK